MRETEIKKGEFASMVSHELKTPLVPIKGHAEMLIEPGLMGNLNEQQFESISAIYANSVRLESLINDVLDVHKLEIGKIKYVHETIEIKPFMEQIFKSYFPIFHEKNITMLNNTSEKTVFINSDSFRLTQVLSNLLGNTIDFVPMIDGVVEIGAEPKDGKIIFYVKDNGIGISKESKEKLFHKFYQVDTSSSRKHAGTGLGLVICKGIVEQLNGRMWVDSKENMGSTFYFELPIKNENGID